MILRSLIMYTEVGGMHQRDTRLFLVEHLTLLLGKSLPQPQYILKSILESSN